MGLRGRLPRAKCRSHHGVENPPPRLTGVGEVALATPTPNPATGNSGFESSISHPLAAVTLSEFPPLGGAAPPGQSLGLEGCCEDRRLNHTENPPKKTPQHP